jgi:hypothetical protein
VSKKTIERCKLSGSTLFFAWLFSRQLAALQNSISSRGVQSLLRTMEMEI